MSITPNGTRVAFLSRNIPPPTTNPAIHTEVFVRNMQDGSLLWASTNVESILDPGSDYVCSHPLLSPVSNTLFFKAAPATNSTNGLVLAHNLDTAETSIIASNCALRITPVLSTDGRYLAYDSAGQIFRYDVQTANHEPVSVNASGNGPAAGDSHSPVTQNGLVIAFVSSGTNLLAPGNSATTDQVYLRDMVAGTTRIITVNTNGQPALRSLHNACPQLDASGTRVVFDHAGSDLVEEDFNEASDVFLFDAATGGVTLISGTLAERPSSTSPRGVIRELNSVSADGQKITFTAFTATNREVFLANLADGNVQQVSSNDPFVGRRASQGVISGDGKFALYFRDDSAGSYVWAANLRLSRRNLDLGTSEEIDVNGVYSMDVFLNPPFYPAINENGNLVVYSKSGILYLKDMTVGTNQVIAQSHFQPRTVDRMRNPKFTPDHRWVLFQHAYRNDITTNTWPSDPLYQHNLFARDLHGTNIFLISADANGAGLGTATAKSISGSGRYVAYDVWPPPRTNIYVFDFATGANTLICSNCSDKH